MMRLPRKLALALLGFIVGMAWVGAFWLAFDLAVKVTHKGG